MVDHLLERVRAGLSDAAGADPRLLALAALAFAAALVCDGSAWRSGLLARGRAVPLRNALAYYVVGSLVNALVPMRAGTATRLGLFARAAGASATATTAAAVGGVRLILLGTVAAIGLGPSMLPLPPYVLALVVAVAVVVAIAARRRLGSFEIAPWICASTVLRLAAAVVVATAFGIERPVAAACAMVAAVSLAGTLPVTPGNAGVGAAAVAFALAAKGVPGDAGLAAGVAYGLVETGVALAAGSAGSALLLLARRRRGESAWPARPAPARAA